MVDIEETVLFTPPNVIIKKGFLNGITKPASSKKREENIGKRMKIVGLKTTEQL
jgi:hypothetical protein